MAGTPDLFVVCKKCGSEVSPYITECPYCGTRLRKRAPKIDRRSGDAAPRPPRRAVRPTLSPLRTNEIPGIRGDPTGRPNATFALLVLSLFGFLVLPFVSDADVALVSLGGDAWRYVTSAFLYPNAWYQLAVLLAIGIFGWRLELRHGPVLVRRALPRLRRRRQRDRRGGRAGHPDLRRARRGAGHARGLGRARRPARPQRRRARRRPARHRGDRRDRRGHAGGRLRAPARSRRSPAC